MKKYLFPVILIILGLILASSLFNPGWFASHDGVFHILRADEAVKMLKSGQFPLRWAGNFDEGYGIPLFNFIYPLPYYLSTALILSGMSSVLAVKLILLVSYLIGGLGIYQLFARENKMLAFFSAALYLATPYQFLNIFVRGALGEVVAMGIIPWVLVSFHDLSHQKALRWYHSLPLALLLIAHNFLGLLFMAFLIAYLFFAKLFSKRALLSFALSLGLAAFFLLPMIVERTMLSSFHNQDFTFRFDQHFVYLKQFLYGKWDYWYSLPGPGDGVSFQLGLAQIIVVALTTIFVALKKRTRKNIFLVFAFFFTVFMMSSRSFYIWDSLTLLQTVQFPWRFLFLTTLLAPLIAFVFLSSFKSKKLQIILITIFLGLALFNVRNYRRPIQFLNEEEFGSLYTLYLTKTATTFRTEILPMWSPQDVRYKSDDVLVSSGNIILEGVVATPTNITFTANNKEEIGELTILRNYFPSWHVQVEGDNSDDLLSPRDDGTISLMLNPGTHDYRVYVGSSNIESIANIISLGSIISVLYVLTRDRKK